MCRRITSSDLRRIAFNDPDLGIDELVEFFSVPECVGWIVEWSYIIGLMQANEFFIQHFTFDNEVERKMLLAEAAKNSRQMRICFTLVGKGDHRNIIHYDRLGWVSYARPGMEVEMRSPVNADFKEAIEC